MRAFLKNILQILLSVFILQSCSPSPSEESVQDVIKKVEKSLTGQVYIAGDSTWTIEDRMKHYGVPGVSIAVIKDFKIAWVKSYGVTDKETGELVTSQTLFQAGSISKPVAAYGALRLAGQGKINPDENVNTYLRTWKLPDNEFTTEKKVSLKHLLSHTGGVTVHGFPGYSPDLPVPSLVQVLDGTSPANSSAIRVDKVPEESFRYSGGGYCIMQQMLIDIEGKPFPEIMKQAVLDPLGMSSSTYDQPLKEEQLKLAATGYLPNGTMTKGKRHTYPEMAAAGLWTTAEDLARFALDIQQTLNGEGNKVLSKKMAAEMLTPFVEDFVGLGIFLESRQGDMYFGHGGWDEGFSSHMIAHKDKGFGVVVLTNSNHPPFINELINAVALTYEWDNFVPVYNKVEIDSADKAAITGRYRISSDEIVSVYAEDGHIFQQFLNRRPAELFKISDSTYITLERNRPIQFKKATTEAGRQSMLIWNPDEQGIVQTYPLMTDSERVPAEFLKEGDFKKAFDSYKALLDADPNDRNIREGTINNRGYELLRFGDIKLAKDIFRVNMLLYPNSSNVYDSYAEACMKNGDLEEAEINYKKSLKLDPKNTNAVTMLEEIRKKMAP